MSPTRLKTAIDGMFDSPARLSRNLQFTVKRTTFLVVMLSVIAGCGEASRQYLKPDSQRKNWRGNWYSTQPGANMRGKLSLGAYPSGVQMGSVGEGTEDTTARVYEFHGTSPRFTIYPPGRGRVAL